MISNGYYGYLILILIPFYIMEYSFDKRIDEELDKKTKEIEKNIKDIEKLLEKIRSD